MPGLTSRYSTLQPDPPRHSSAPPTAALSLPCTVRCRLAPAGPLLHGAAKPRPDGRTAVYRRREPTATPLYPSRSTTSRGFLADAAERIPTARGVPRWVEDDLRAYLRCGILAHGFARIRCDAERLVA